MRCKCYYLRVSAKPAAYCCIAEAFVSYNTGNGELSDMTENGWHARKVVLIIAI